MDMVLGGLVHVHVDHHRSGRRMGHLQARLLDALPDHRLRRGLTGIEMPTGLHPAKKAAVAVEDHPPVTDHDGRGGDMGQDPRSGRRAGRAGSNSTSMMSLDRDSRGSPARCSTNSAEGVRRRPRRQPSSEPPSSTTRLVRPVDRERVRPTCGADGGCGAVPARWCRPRPPRALDWPARARGRTLALRTGRRSTWPHLPPHRRPGRTHLDRCPGRLRACARWHSWERHFLITCWDHWSNRTT